MMAKTHKWGGAITSLGLLMTVPQEPVVAIGTVCCGVIGALFPDIDHHNSYITKKMGILGKLISLIFKHRGITHSVVFHTAAYVILLWSLHLPYSILATSWYFGVLSHIFLDLLNPRGLAVFAPLSKKKISLGNIDTNSIGEVWFRSGLAVTCTAMGVMFIMKSFGPIMLNFMTLS